MKMIKEKIVEYLELTIQTKRNMRRRIYQLETENKELKLDIADVIKQKDKYKESNRLLRRKQKEVKNGSANKKKGHR